MSFNPMDVIKKKFSDFIGKKYDKYAEIIMAIAKKLPRKFNGEPALLIIEDKQNHQIKMFIVEMDGSYTEVLDVMKKLDLRELIGMLGAMDPGEMEKMDIDKIDVNKILNGTPQEQKA